MDAGEKPLPRDSSAFIPPPALQKLRTQNEQLRQELRDLSGRLDELLSTYPKKTANPSALRSKEISNTRAQLEHYEKQLRDLQRQQALISPTKVAELQGQANELLQQIKAKEASNKGLRRLQNDRGVTLSSMASGTGNYPELKSATDEYRRASRAVSEIEKEIQRGEEVHKTVTEKVVTLEAKFKEIVSQGGAPEDDEPKPIPVGTQDLDTIKVKVDQLEKKKASDQSAFRREVQSAEAQLSLLQKQTADAQTLVKEKERKARVSALAVKEASYNLKMLNKKNSNMEAAIKAEASTSKEGGNMFITSSIGEEKPEDKGLEAD